MTSPPIDLTFVIPVRNDARRLQSCLQSIARAKEASSVSIQVIVVDNGSTDNSRDVAAASGSTVIAAPGVRVSELRNRGAAAAIAPRIAFVDADHTVAPRWISAALEALEDDGVGAAGAPYTSPPGATWVQRMYGGLRRHRHGRRDTEWLGSGNLVVKREAFVAIGGFDASLEACEDVDFCRRLRAAGWRLVADSQLESVHHGDPATLRTLFIAELWRGRDNLRVSFARPIDLSALPSALAPVMTLISLAAAGIAVVSGRPSVAVFCLAPFALLAALRSAVILRGLAGRRLLDVFRAAAVAATYESARAFALLLRRPHHRDPSRQVPSPAKPA